MPGGNKGGVGQKGGEERTSAPPLACKHCVHTLGAAREGYQIPVRFILVPHSAPRGAHMDTSKNVERTPMQPQPLYVFLLPGETG